MSRVMLWVLCVALASAVGVAVAVGLGALQQNALPVTDTAGTFINGQPTPLK